MSFRLACQRCGQIGLFATVAGIYAAAWVFAFPVDELAMVLRSNSTEQIPARSGLCSRCVPKGGKLP